MGVILLLALAVLGWAWFTGRLGADAGRKVALAVGGILTVWLMARGQIMPALGLGAATAAFGFAGYLRRKVGVMPMDELEARQVLGVGPGATEEEIRAAHRRLIAQVHPDRGGSAELARRVNLARDRLLKDLNPGG
jgi:hypothetical protein